MLIRATDTIWESSLEAIHVAIYTALLIGFSSPADLESSRRAAGKGLRKAKDRRPQVET